MTLRTHDVGYWYTSNSDDYFFKDVNLTSEKGEVYSILGQSGSGKTIFFSLLTGSSGLKAGETCLEDNDINKFGSTNYCKNSVSTIFQAYNLMTYVTAHQDVQTVLEISNKPVGNTRIEEFFEPVGTPKEMIDKPVLQLSGGQQQRVAIVHVLAIEHNLIIADKPTGNLDEETTQDIVNIFKDIAYRQNKTVVTVTYEAAVAQETDVTPELKKKQFTEV